MVQKLKCEKQIEVQDTLENVHKWNNPAHNIVKMAIKKKNRVEHSKSFLNFTKHIFSEFINHYRQF